MTEPLHLRGDAQAAVQAGYAAVQATLVRFFQTAVAGKDGMREFEGWVTDTTRASGVYTVTVHGATTPAPTLQAVLATLGGGTATMLREAHGRDPLGPVFSADSMEEIAARALTQRQFAIALEVIAFARSLYADARVLLLLESEALDGPATASGPRSPHPRASPDRSRGRGTTVLLWCGAGSSSNGCATACRNRRWPIDRPAIASVLKRGRLPMRRSFSTCRQRCLAAGRDGRLLQIDDDVADRL